MTRNARFWAPFVARFTLVSQRPASPIVALAEAQTADQNKAVVKAKFDAWKAGTGTNWTIEGNSVAPKHYPAKEAFLTEVIRPFNAPMSVGIKPAVRSVTAQEDRVVVFDAAGIAKDGKPYTNTYAWFFHMKSGRGFEANAFFDAIAFNDLWARVTPTE